MKVESIRWRGCHDAKAPRKERKHRAWKRGGHDLGDALCAENEWVISAEKGTYFKFRTQSLAILEINDGDPAR
jgi:hypothetical protein